MHARMQNPAAVVPGAMQALMALGAAIKQTGLPPRTVYLVLLRASQINGCGFCVDMHARELKSAGESHERIVATAAWRESPHFDDAERAALALAEAATRLSDRPDPVPDPVWEEAARHYEGPTLAALVLAIATINLWNRINVTTRQIAGTAHR